MSELLSFFKHRTNYYSVRSAGRSLRWSTILKSVDPLVAFERAIGDVICRCIPTTVLRGKSGAKQWFDANCRRAYDAKQTAYRAWCRARNAEHWGRFLLVRAEAQSAYGAAKESHNELTRNTLKHFSCSHRWWETLKGSIFGVNPSIHALMGPGGGLVTAPAAKTSLLDSQFDSKQCREQLVTHLSSFPQSRCNSLACQTSVLLRLFLDHDTYGGVDPLGVLPLFLKKVEDIIAQKLCIMF